MSFRECSVLLVTARDSTRTGTGTVPGRNNVTGPVLEHFLFRRQTMRSIFARCLAYNITILQMIDMTVTSNVW